MNLFKDYMNEQRLLKRWVILVVALIGGLVGAILMFLFALLGLFA